MDLVLVGSNLRGFSSRWPFPGSVRCCCWGSDPWWLLNRTKFLEDRLSSSLPTVRTVCLFLCLSVSQLYPLSALHAESQNMGFQEAGVQTIANRDFICPSGSKIQHIIIVEWLQIVQHEWYNWYFFLPAYNACVFPSAAAKIQSAPPFTNSPTSWLIACFPAVIHLKSWGQSPCGNSPNQAVWKVFWAVKDTKLAQFRPYLSSKQFGTKRWDIITTQSSTNWKCDVCGGSSSDKHGRREVDLFLAHRFTCRTQPVFPQSVYQGKWYAKVESHVRCLSSPWILWGTRESPSLPSRWTAPPDPSSCCPSITWKKKRKKG